MNIYARFFDHETVVPNVEQLMDFFSTLPEIHVTPQMEEDIRAYVDSDMPYPKRYKISPRIYFILIKTTAQTLEEFKAHKKSPSPMKAADNEAMGRKNMKTMALAEMNRGWYRGSITFKRVLQIPGTGKYQYQDTSFEALVLCNTGQECYNRIVAYLKNRTDVDMRSQFPSAKGASFDFEYLGTELPETLQTDQPL